MTGYTTMSNSLAKLGFRMRDCTTTEVSALVEHSKALKAAPKKAKAPSAAFGLFTMDGLDGVVYSLAQAKREAKDLRGMGFEVRCIKADTEDTLYQLEEMTRGKANGMPTKAMQAKVSGTVVKL